LLLRAHRGCLPCLMWSSAAGRCVVCVIDVPRRPVSTGPALTCLTCRRCRTAPFALRATATSDPFFRCAVVLQNEDSQPLITPSYTIAGACAVGVALASKDRRLSFVVRRSTPCLASFLSQGLALCLWRAGEVPVLCAAVCCVPFASALGSGRGGAARGLEVRGPVLQPQASGLGAGYVAEDRAQWRRGCDGPAWWPTGLALGERSWPLITGKSAGPCGVLAPSLGVRGTASAV